MVSHMGHQIRCLGDESKRVVFLVSHSDIAERLEEMIPDIYRLMEDKNLRQQVVFYSNKRCFPAKLTRILFRIASSFPLAPVTLD